MTHHPNSLLHERWRQIAATRRSELALVESGSGSRWTFGQLATAAETGADPGPVSFPQGANARFIVEGLRAWRFNHAVCPLEPAQVPPVIGQLPANIVHLKSTSASTGSARLVAFTAAQLAADADNIVATMGLRPDWPNLGVISLAHSYGFSNLVLPLLLHGIPLILVETSLPETVRRAAAGWSALTLPAVPALWRAWHDAGAIPPNVRLAISAGAPLPLALEEMVFKTRGLKLHNFYGATECGGIAYDASEQPRSDSTLAGTPLQTVRLARTEDGCLEIRSAAVGETYWPTPAENLRAGVYRTSDLTELKGAEVYLRGRAGDLINVAGRKVSPETIERALAAHPAVNECLVFGAPSADEQRVESIVACLVARAAVTDHELKQFLLDQLPGWQLPRKFWFVDSLAVNQRGKLSRTEWRSRYLATQPPM